MASYLCPTEEIIKKDFMNKFCKVIMKSSLYKSDWETR